MLARKVVTLIKKCLKLKAWDQCFGFCCRRRHVYFLTVIHYLFNSTAAVELLSMML